ncbi:hypothetical protein Vafri_698 [Volvox africanus]|nr:hypothetical protein Vafri_698 [Volvox africanus]
MWAAQPAPDRGISPSFIIGLVLLLFIMTADMSSWGSNSSSSSQQVRLGQQQAQAQAQEVRDKLMYELTLSNERLEKENRQLHLQLLVLRRLLRSCRGNGTSGGSASEIMELAQSELALATAGDSGQNKAVRSEKSEYNGGKEYIG